MKEKLQIKGVWAPLVTPFDQGKFDSISMINLIKEIEPLVDGFVPCLSSGEGSKMSDELWGEVLKTVVQNTQKPVVVGILRDSIAEIISLSKIAKSSGCVAIVAPLQGSSSEEQRSFCKEVSDKSALPVVIYNTEKKHIDSPDNLIAISKNENIISLKDSSQNQKFFDAIVQMKKNKIIDMSIFQGMENQLLESVGCDGYLISLANVEPQLCKEMFNNPSEGLNQEIMKKRDEFSLASEDWFVGIKKALAFRGVIKSAELIK
jgi:4-hydroxy-tetrahydrodipicolinate synthase